ncbi:MAG: ferritin family protein [Planctomycetota bacterium]|jgi:rubrerythrin
MKSNSEDTNFPDDHVDAYRKALEVELKSEAFYKEKAEEVEEAYAKELFLKIAAEEKKHAHLLEHIIDFITKPDTWLESAEFRNIEDF